MMSKHQRIIEEIIQSAMREGAFDDLPGEGQPLNLDPRDFTDDDWQLAHHLLKQNGFAPEFIEVRKSIEEDLEQIEAEFRRAREWKNQALELGEPVQFIDQQWDAAQAQYAEAITELNKRIRDYNLMIPAQNFYRRPISDKTGGSH